jgi:hypothetical protein
MKKIRFLTTVVIFGMLTGCNNYLDIVPDNIATIDHAFSMRTTAEKFLFTCYSYLPAHGAFATNAANAAGDEFWLPATNSTQAWQIARGNQRVVDPYMNFWQGTQGGKDLYEGIRQCNIFLDNIGIVPDMEDYEKERWIAEVKFLKAYYHFYLLRMYGPIPLIRENVPVNAGTEEVYPTRSPVDECFSYIVELLDEAIGYLPDKIENEITELGRVTKATGLAQKAIVLTYAASPFFNGNTDYSGWKNVKGEELFNPDEDAAKWQKAADACREAIEFCESQGYNLYEFAPEFFQYAISDTIRTQMSIRNSVCEKWNSEIIWGNTNSRAGTLQAGSTPRGLDPAYTSNSSTSSYIAPTIKMAEMFYTENGVPITEDKTWDYAGRWSLKMGDAASRLYIREGYTTVSMHFDREPRFYASLGFDGAIWYGQGRFDDSNPQNLLYVSCKKGQPASAQNMSSYSVAGYWPKKIVNYNNVIGVSTYTIEQYPWPEIRLANLCLLYAEVLNEVSGPSDEVYKWINLIRQRAGLKTVEESWEVYSANPAKYKSRTGLREIIRRERLIELAFEGQRYWDLRRWKECVSELNKPVTGWDVEQEDAGSYYRTKVIFNQQFTTRDYLWPINENELLGNKNIGQNPGW